MNTVKFPDNLVFSLNRADGVATIETSHPLTMCQVDRILPADEAGQRAMDLVHVEGSDEQLVASFTGNEDTLVLLSFANAARAAASASGKFATLREIA